MKETHKFTLEVEIEIDGKRPSDEVLNDRFIGALNETFPSIVFDDDELDCSVFVNSWEYVPNPSFNADSPEAGEPVNSTLGGSAD